MNSSATAYETLAANHRRVSEMKRARAAAPILTRLLRAAAYTGIALALVAALMLGPPQSRDVATVAGDGSDATSGLPHRSFEPVAAADTDRTPMWLLSTCEYCVDVFFSKRRNENVSAAQEQSGGDDTRIAVNR